MAVETGRRRGETLYEALLRQQKRRDLIGWVWTVAFAVGAITLMFLIPW